MGTRCVSRGRCGNLRALEDPRLSSERLCPVAHRSALHLGRTPDGATRAGTGDGQPSSTWVLPTLLAPGLSVYHQHSTLFAGGTTKGIISMISLVVLVFFFGNSRNIPQNFK